MTVRRDVSLSPRQSDLKLRFRSLVESVGGVELAAQFCRVGKSNLSDYCLINTDSFAPIDVVADLEEHVQSRGIGLPVTEALAIRAGHVVVKLPVAPEGARDWLGGMGALAKEAGDITARIAGALADDQGIDPAEAENIMKEIDEAAAALMALRKLAERTMEDG